MASCKIITQLFCLYHPLAGYRPEADLSATYLKPSTSLRLIPKTEVYATASTMI